jgi:hypothetical protein
MAFSFASCFMSTRPAASLAVAGSSSSRSAYSSCTSRSVSGLTTKLRRGDAETRPSWRSRDSAARIGALPKA